MAILLQYSFPNNTYIIRYHTETKTNSLRALLTSFKVTLPQYIFNVIQTTIKLNDAIYFDSFCTCFDSNLLSNILHWERKSMAEKHFDWSCLKDHAWSIIFGPLVFWLISEMDLHINLVIQEYQLNNFGCLIIEEICLNRMKFRILECGMI